MYTVAKAAHSRATSFAVAQHSFLQLLKLKMTTTFTDYLDRLLAQKDAFTAIFDPEGTGMMAIENIITMVLINGLPDEFKYMKDLMVSKDLMGEFPDFKETLQAMKVEDSSTIVVPLGPTILTATSTVGLKAECGICHKEFNATLRKSDGKRHPNCYSCNLKARQAKESATANPTPCDTVVRTGTPCTGTVRTCTSRTSGQPVIYSHVSLFSHIHRYCSLLCSV